MDWNELPLDLGHQGVPSGVIKMISKPMVRSTQTVYLSCVDINTIFKQTEMIFETISIFLEKKIHRYVL
jgi:hypothetical protein